MLRSVGTNSLAILIVGLGSALASCATRPIDNKASIDTDVIRLRVSAMSWGNRTEIWSLDRGGKGRHAHVEDIRAPLPTESEFPVPAADFDAALNDLAPLERRLGFGIPCDVMATDQDTYDVTWDRTGVSSTLSIYFGCPSPVLDELRSSLKKAHERVLQLEAGAPQP
jgi:hypothetical protein